MTQAPFLFLREHPAFRAFPRPRSPHWRATALRSISILGGSCVNRRNHSLILVILQGQIRLVGRHNGRLTTVGKFCPGSVVGAAVSLSGAPCENVIAAEEVIACAVSDQLWRELYSQEASFRHWCDQQLWPQELLKLLEVLEQTTPEADSSALKNLRKRFS